MLCVQKWWKHSTGNLLSNSKFFKFPGCIYEAKQMLWFAYSLQKEGKLQESKLHFQRLNYPSTPQRPKWSLYLASITLQSLKSNPHILLFQETDWLYRHQIHCYDSSTNLWKLCTWICCSMWDMKKLMTIRERPWTSRCQLSTGKW